MNALQPHDWQELERLVDGACDRMLTSDEWLALGQWLIDSPEARDHYMACMDLHGTLALQIMPTARLSVAELQHFAQAESDTQGMEGDCDADRLTSESPSFVLPDTAAFAPIGIFSSGWPMAYLVATVVFGIALVVGAIVNVSDPTQVVQRSNSINTPNPQFPIPIPSPNAAIVARITGMVDCVWEGAGFKGQGLADSGQRPVVSGQNSTDDRSLFANHYPRSTVCLGDRFALKSGLLEITYNTGARLVLQGPVTYEVESPAGGFLSIGKLTAELEKKNPPSPGTDRRLVGRGAEGESGGNSPLFAVRTPTAVVTDLGTEFGVEVSRTGATSTHVFLGTVEIASLATNGRKSQTVRLTANETADVDEAKGSDPGTIHRGLANPAGFVRAADLPRQTQRESRNALESWRTHSEMVRRDPALVVHYDFQRHADSPDVLHAEASGKRSPLDGRIENAAWTTGRMPGKQALRFDGDQARVRISIPGELTHLTLAAWLAIESINDQNLGCCLLVADWSNTFAEKAAWQIYRQGELRFGTPVCDSETPPLLPWRTWGSNRWRHLVVTTNPSQQQVAYYIDGKKVFSGGISDKFVARFGAAQIGNWWSNNNRNERGFCGRMDDLMIFARTLADQEIVEMYEAGKK
jgi:hypothetical protein